MLQAFDQRPHGSVERCGYANSLPLLHDSAVHEIDLGLALGHDILQHTRTVFPWGICAFSNQSTGVAMKCYPQLLSYGFTFGDQVVGELAGGSESRGRAVMKQG